MTLSYQHQKQTMIHTRKSKYSTVLLAELMFLPSSVFVNFKDASGPICVLARVMFQCDGGGPPTGKRTWALVAGTF